MQRDPREQRTWARDELIRHAIANGMDWVHAGELVDRCVAQELMRRGNTRELLAALRREARATGRSIDNALRRLMSPGAQRPAPRRHGRPQA